jgi:hypothetical protein
MIMIMKVKVNAPSIIVIVRSTPRIVPTPAPAPTSKTTSAAKGDNAARLKDLRAVRKGGGLSKFGKAQVSDLKRLGTADEAAEGPKFRRAEIQELRTSKMRSAWKDCEFQLNKKSAQVLKMKEVHDEKVIDKKHRDFKLQDVQEVVESPGGQWHIRIMDEGKLATIKFKSPTSEAAAEWVKDINHNISFLRK